MDEQDLECHFTAADLEELNSVAAAVEASGIALENITKDTFPLPTLGPKLQAIHEDLIFGRGIRVLKNLPLGLDHSMRWIHSSAWGRPCMNAAPHCIDSTICCHHTRRSET